MLYPIKVLNNKCFEIDNEINRIMNVPISGKHDSEIKKALRKLKKRKKDLNDAVRILVKISTVDELNDREVLSIKAIGNEH